MEDGLCRCQNIRKFYHNIRKFNMYYYKLWGAEIESDTELDVVNDNILRGWLVELKMNIDRFDVITGRFDKQQNKIRSYPRTKDLEKWIDLFNKRNEKPPIGYEIDITSGEKWLDVYPIYDSWDPLEIDNYKLETKTKINNIGKLHE